jgi:hypothetical protein
MSVGGLLRKGQLSSRAGGTSEHRPRAKTGGRITKPRRAALQVGLHGTYTLIEVVLCTIISTQNRIPTHPPVQRRATHGPAWPCWVSRAGSPRTTLRATVTASIRWPYSFLGLCPRPQSRRTRLEQRQTHRKRTPATAQGRASGTTGGCPARRYRQATQPGPIILQTSNCCLYC